MKKNLEKPEHDTTKYGNMYPNDRSSIHRTLSYSNAVEYTNIWAAYIECRTMDIIL